MALSPEWQSLVDEKRAHLKARIPSSWVLPDKTTDKVNHTLNTNAFELLNSSSLLSPQEKEITESYTATTLIKLMCEGKYTSVQVTTAFCKRAAIAQQLTNCLTEIFFDKALARAQRCDEYLAKEGRPIGPLHGLPISLKDTLMVEGEAACLGFVAYLKKPVAARNSFVVDMLLEAGAVLYVKTNVPQTLFVCESYNNVFGHTMNPYNLSLSAGGSSSGEGAIVGIRGALLGLGSDIGGSVRIPAIFNGAYGFKPTQNRLPYGRQQDLIPKGWPGTVPTLGPLAVSSEDLTLFTKTLLLAKPWTRDSTALAVPWRQVPQSTCLRIGFFQEDPVFPVLPPVKRALTLAAEKLEAAGHQIIPLDQCPSLLDSLNIISRGFSLDTSHTTMQHLAAAGEQPIPPLVSMSQAMAHGNEEAVGIDDVWRFRADREDYLEEWGKIWRENSLDILLCPGYQGVGAPHDHVGVPHYTAIWNLLDFPASVIPFQKADRSVDTQEVPGYDPTIVDGVPSHIQIVGWRFQDEEVLSATEVISKVLS